jgi:hypothetical protein
MNILTNEERQALGLALSSSVSTPTSPQGGSTNHFMSHHANV